MIYDFCIYLFSESLVYLFLICISYVWLIELNSLGFKSEIKMYAANILNITLYLEI